jgi:hypothetical protein
MSKSFLIERNGATFRVMGEVFAKHPLTLVTVVRE